MKAGWHQVITSDELRDEDGTFSRDGFYAIAFVNHSKREIVIAFQGTENIQDMVSNAQLAFNEIARSHKSIFCSHLYAEVLSALSCSLPKFKIFEIMM